MSYQDISRLNGLVYQSLHAIYIPYIDSDRSGVSASLANLSFDSVDRGL
jgi:hypothetical protein